jgi:chromate transporter
MASSISLKELFWVFIKIGSTSWGGSMPLVAVAQSYIKKNNLLDEREVLDTIFLSSVLPGAMAFNVVVGLGYRLRGIKGALVCGVGVLCPAFLLVVGLSFAYFKWGQIPIVDKLFLGFIPAIVAIILSIAWSMGRKIIKRLPEIAISLAACAILLEFKGFYSTIGIILGSGLIGWLSFQESPTIPSKSSELTLAAKSQSKSNDSNRLLSVSVLPSMWLLTIQPLLVLKLFTGFALASLTLFGGGYVFIPIIQKLVVDSQGWVTNKEFIDGLVISQITPGPILVTSTFIGYKVAGLLGAISATAGMCLPPALLMIGGTYFLETLQKSSGVRAALRGIRLAVVGMLMAAAVVVGSTATLHWGSIVIFVVTLIAIVRFRVEVALLLPFAGLASLILY